MSAALWLAACLIALVVVREWYDRPVTEPDTWSTGGGIDQAMARRGM